MAPLNKADAYFYFGQRLFVGLPTLKGIVHSFPGSTQYMNPADGHADAAVLGILQQASVPIGQPIEGHFPPIRLYPSEPVQHAYIPFESITPSAQHVTESPPELEYALFA